MGKFMGKPRTGMNFEEHFGQIDPWQTGEDLVAQCEQARWLIELVEPSQRQGVATFHLFDADSGIGRKVGAVC